MLIDNELILFLNDVDRSISQAQFIAEKKKAKAPYVLRTAISMMDLLICCVGKKIDMVLIVSLLRYGHG